VIADDFLFLRHLHIRMYVREHLPPHFHAVYGEFEANVSIDNGEVIEGRLPRNARRLVREWRNSGQNLYQIGGAHNPDLRRKG
jgi:hypothetical protein